jgi:hypothetical protein
MTKELGFYPDIDKWYVSFPIAFRLLLRLTKPPGYWGMFVQR